MLVYHSVTVNIPWGLLGVLVKISNTHSINSQPTRAASNQQHGKVHWTVFLHCALEFKGIYSTKSWTNSFLNFFLINDRAEEGVGLPA